MTLPENANQQSSNDSATNSNLSSNTSSSSSSQHQATDSLSEYKELNEYAAVAKKLFKDCPQSKDFADATSKDNYRENKNYINNLASVMKRYFEEHKDDNYKWKFKTIKN